MEFCTILFGFVTVLLAIFYRYWTRFNGYFRELGIPVERYNTFFKQNIHYIESDKKSLARFGSIWGRFDGARPVVVVADPKLIKEIVVKNFDKFPNHIDFGVEERHWTLIDAKYATWKPLRKSLTPTFTSGKLKGMMQHIGQVAENMITCLRETTAQSSNGVINIKPVFQGLSLDTIANCAFGIDTNSFKNPDNILFQRCLAAFSDFRLKNHLENAVLHFVENLPFLLPFLDLYGKENFDHFNKTTREILDARNASRGGDFIDRLKEMIAELKSKTEDTPLTEEIIVAQGIVFFIAGFETSSNTLSTLAYNLAKNPDVQERIAQEVKSVLDEFNGVIDYETINQMPYLEATINENLRICPPVIRLDRTCTEDCTIGQYHFRKDSLVNFPIYAMHHNPKYFPEPEKFQPERFLKSEDGQENGITQFAYIPFGGGPRQCIGMRFAIVEIKIAMAKLLANFRIIETPETKLDFLPGDPFFLTYPEVKVKLEPRSF